MTASVSAILPNYNYARFLKERVRSIAGQTVPPREILYVDDASTDRSADVIRTFQDVPNLKMRECPENSGTVYRRWNEAAEEATGDWLWFPNADDSADPFFLERMAQMAQAHPSAALLYARPTYMNGTGVITHSYVHWYNDAMREFGGVTFEKGSDVLALHTSTCFLKSASAVLIRRDAFTALGGFDTRLWGIADWDFYLRMLHGYDFAYTATPLCFLRAHEENTTGKTDHTRKSLLDAYCVAAAYERMAGDTRYGERARAEARRQAKLRLFELLIEKELVVAPALRFAVEALQRVTPHRRLQALLETP